MKENDILPLTEDEKKGLLYGSLIAAGLAAMSGRGVGGVLQNAGLGFGVAYSGGLQNLLAEKEMQLKQLREQEQLNLNKMLTESNVATQELNRRLAEQEELRKKQYFEVMNSLSDYFEKNEMPDVAQVIKAGDLRGAMDLAVTKYGLDPRAIIEHKGKAYYANLFGRPIAPAYSDKDIKASLEIENFYNNIYKEIKQSALTRASLESGIKLNPDQSLMLITQNIMPQIEDPAKAEEFRNLYWDYLKSGVLASVSVGELPDNFSKKVLIEEAAMKQYRKEREAAKEPAGEPQATPKKPKNAELNQGGLQMFLTDLLNKVSNLVYSHTKSKKENKEK